MEAKLPIVYVESAKQVVIPNVGDIVLARVNFVTAVYSHRLGVI